MDRITQSLLNEFSDENSLNKLDDSKKFEHFSSHVIMTNHYPESFSTFDTVTGNGNDLGIDSIAVLVNGQLINDTEELEGFLGETPSLDVTFIFLQADRGDGFDSKKLGHFGEMVLTIFNNDVEEKSNNSIKVKIDLINKIYENSALFKKGNPECFLYYVTTGNWVGDKNLVSKKTRAIKNIVATNMLRNVDMICLGAKDLQDLYRKSKNSITAEINFPNKTVYPEISGVEQAYLGLLDGFEYLKLIKGENDELRSYLFFDNVRHWQGWNSVNENIKSTIEDKEERYCFPLFNNGVTIVCSKISSTGNKFFLEDYQIVNGCQTSHVIYYAREAIDNNIMIPVRLIATENENIKNKIIESTNKQTAVDEQELFALTEFPKKLETYFPSFEDKKKIYYERRSKQYVSTNIEKVRVINMKSLIRAYASMFREQPHRTTRDYKSLLKSLGQDIFHKEHVVEMYYVAAYAYFRLEFLFRNGFIDTDYKPARYVILLGFRMLAGGNKLPQPNSRHMKKYCDNIMKILWDDEKSNATFLQAAKLAKKISGETLKSDGIRTETFTSKYIAEINSMN